MTTKISPRDWESLSAYLDGQLNPNERARLEIRFKESEALQSALDELMRTRELLRSQPRLKAPRNFTLTPEMAGMRSGQRPIPSAYPALRLASVLATIFFLVVFFGDLALNVFQPGPLKAAQAPRQEAVSPGGLPPIGLGGGEGPDEEPAEKALVAPEAEEPAAEAAVEMEVLATQAGANKLGEAAAEKTDTLQAEGLPLATPSPAATIAAYQDAGYPVPEGEILEEIPLESYLPPAPPAYEIPVADSPDTIGWPVLRWIQVILLFLAIATGFAALYLRRTSRS
jgi:anti-sigma factor RsiW